MDRRYCWSGEQFDAFGVIHYECRIAAIIDHDHLDNIVIETSRLADQLTEKCVENFLPAVAGNDYRKLHIRFHRFHALIDLVLLIACQKRNCTTYRWVLRDLFVENKTFLFKFNCFRTMMSVMREVQTRRNLEVSSTYGAPPGQYTVLWLCVQSGNGKRLKQYAIRGNIL